MIFRLKEVKRSSFSQLVFLVVRSVVEFLISLVAEIHATFSVPGVVSAMVHLTHWARVVLLGVHRVELSGFDGSHVQEACHFGLFVSDSDVSRGCLRGLFPVALTLPALFGVRECTPLASLFFVLPLLELWESVLTSVLDQVVVHSVMFHGCSTFAHFRNKLIF